jgi:Tfp pilus assembly protein FimT
VVLRALGGGSAGNEYANGWEVAVDDNGDGSIGNAELRVRRSAVTLERVTLTGPTEVGFRATGALVGTAAQTFTLCRTGGSRGYTVTVMPSGVTDVMTIDSCTP